MKTLIKRYFLCFFLIAGPIIWLEIWSYLSAYVPTGIIGQLISVVALIVLFGLFLVSVKTVQYIGPYRTVYIVGEMFEQSDSGKYWGISGVYTSERVAFNSCKKENEFIGPVPLNTATTGARWPGCYYPNARAEKENPCDSCSQEDRADCENCIDAEHH
jgi:hypothetical protein